MLTTADTPQLDPLVACLVRAARRGRELREQRSIVSVEMQNSVPAAGQKHADTPSQPEDASSANTH